MTVISENEKVKYAQLENSLVIDLVSGAFAPTRYEQELWVWGLGATKYTRKSAKSRLAKRWKRVAEKTNIVNRIEGKDIYIVTKNGEETIYVKFFKRFLEYLKKNPQG